MKLKNFVPVKFGANQTIGLKVMAIIATPFQRLDPGQPTVP